MTVHELVVGAAFLLFKSPFRNLWPLAAAPALAALISDRAARFAAQTPAGSAPAAALAALPGLVGLAVVGQALDFGHVLTWRGVVVHWLTPALAGGWVAFAAVRTLQRQRQLGRVFALAQPARGRLAELAAELGVPVREIPSDDRDCFAAGALRPTVFVSTGALARLDEGQLRAALHHERAHVQGRDTLALVILGFLRDVAPWGRGVALDAFRAAREAVADRAAARAAGALNLAAALVALARPGGGPAPAAVLPMARADTFSWRMQALLGGGAAPEPSPRERARLMIGLAAGVALLAWPAVQFQLMELLCGVT